MFSAGCDSSALCKCSAIRKWTILVKWSSSSQMAPPASSTSFSLKLNSTKSSNTSVSTACAEKSNIVAWRASAAKVLLYDDKWSFHVSQVSLRSLVTSRATVYGGVVNDIKASASDFLHKKTYRLETGLGAVRSQTGSCVLQPSRTKHAQCRIKHPEHLRDHPPLCS